MITIFKPGIETRSDLQKRQCLLPRPTTVIIHFTITINLHIIASTTIIIIGGILELDNFKINNDSIVVVVIVAYLDIVESILLIKTLIFTRFKVIVISRRCY